MIKEFFEDESGQAIVEYILALVLAILVIVIIAESFRTTVLRLWQTMAREISAACPGCPPDPSVRLR